MDKKLVSKQQLRQFIKENKMSSVQDVQDMLKDLFAETLQEMLEAELDDSLGYAKHDVQNKRTTNSCNGEPSWISSRRNGTTNTRLPSVLGEQIGRNFRPSSNIRPISARSSTPRISSKAITANYER